MFRALIFSWTVVALSLLATPSWSADISAAHDVSQPITVAADWCSRWQQGVYEVYHLRGNCYLNQGLTYARAPEAVIWIDRSAMPTKVLVYLEATDKDRVVVDYRKNSSGNQTERSLGHETSSTWFQRLYTAAPLQFKLPAPAPKGATRPAVYDRGLAQFDPKRRRQLMLAQFTEFAPVPAVQSISPGMRSIQMSPRNDSSPAIDSKQQPGGGRITVVSGGIRVLVEGLASADALSTFGPVGTIDISTDRAVIWTAGNDLGFGGQAVQSQDTPLEIYMEGNIEFRQGDRVIYADRMFYDVRRRVGVILNAELLTPLPQVNNFQYQGMVRLRASAIRQLDESHFSATNAQLTTSRLEEPTYHFSSNEISFRDVQSQVFDPLTGESQIKHQQLAESHGNTVYIRGIPVFYWPNFATDLSKPSFITDRISVGSDRIFGNQLRTEIDAYQLFGIRNAPQGTDWGLNLDYLSDRGLGHGTTFKYDRPELLGFEGPARGQWDFWGISDDGLDNLGLGRRAIAPEEDYRYRLFGQHRQRFRNGWEMTAELGWISDRTFLEQFYESDWDQLKDPRSGLRLNRLADNRSLSIEANAQLNSFFTETQWLPRVDHYWLGESLFGDRLTWFEHSQAGYANLNVANPPTNATLAGQFTLLPWEEVTPGSGIPISGNGERLVTRQEIDMPFSLGAVKVVPYVLGELAHWGEALDGNDLQRAYMNTGVRASIPVWAVFPEVRDSLFNLNGLAHKVVFDAEFSYADANQNFTDLPLYDPLDDIATIEMRRRVLNGTLAPTITSLKFDPRFYAF